MQHVVFGHSGAGTLKQALALRGRREQVLAFGDDLSWGPIGADNLAARVRFFEAESPIPDGWSWLVEETEEFWREIDRPQEARLIWLGSQSAAELAGYLAYLDRCHAVPARVVRPDDYLAPHPVLGPAGAIGSLDVDDINHVLDNAPTRPVADDAALFGRWSELVSESALLRVRNADRLESAPLDYFDPFLLNAATEKWKRAVRVVGDAMAAGFDARIRLNAELLFSRLAHLARTGVLEADGDVLAWAEDMRRSPAHVRKPRAK